MYLYEGCRDPIQMISGDAYGATLVAQTGHNNKLKREPVKRKNQPTKKLVDGRKREKFPGSNEIIHRYLLNQGATLVADKIGMSVQATRRRANRLGYRFIGNPRVGHWKAPEAQGRF